MHACTHTAVYTQKPIIVVSIMLSVAYGAAGSTYLLCMHAHTAVYTAIFFYNDSCSS
jgi:hypothetical protein